MYFFPSRNNHHHHHHPPTTTTHHLPSTIHPPSHTQGVMFQVLDKYYL